MYIYLSACILVVTIISFLHLIRYQNDLLIQCINKTPHFGKPRSTNFSFNNAMKGLATMMIELQYLA